MRQLSAFLIIMLFMPRDDRIICPQIRTKHRARKDSIDASLETQNSWGRAVCPAGGWRSVPPGGGSAFGEADIYYIIYCMVRGLVLLEASPVSSSRRPSESLQEKGQSARGRKYLAQHAAPSM